MSDTSILLIESDILIDIQQNNAISNENINKLREKLDILSKIEKTKIKRNILTVTSKYIILKDKSIDEIKALLIPIISKIQPLYNFNLDFVVDFLSISRELEKDDIEISKKIGMLRACINDKPINDSEIEAVYYRQLLNIYLSRPDAYMDEIIECSTLLKTKYKEEL
ncbi:hypothetical protein [Vallitalea maricola]|uniref:Uncharacterized protein n=1 Tax=Vallitalea maricola TaxID=3074433 RepID=A0ACB5UP53_9FIRM|nr:hypothetical protein AN2V17_35660 [Vallitalea sp. AN17-2]